MTTSKPDSVLLTLKLSPELKESFNQAVRQNDRNASQVLREFMRSYIEAQGVSKTERVAV
jgi:predicted DNA-binding protein